jgi:enoyl-CoA hydratase/carnithine racemase
MSRESTLDPHPPMSAFTTQHENGIAVVTFDLPGEPVNKLTSAVRVELEVLLNQLRDDAALRADLGQG